MFGVRPLKIPTWVIDLCFSMTHVTWIDSLRNKKVVPYTFEEFQRFVQTQYTAMIKKLHSINGGEHANDQIKEFKKIEINSTQIYTCWNP